MRIHFLSEFSGSCQSEILLPWQRDVTTSPLYIMGNITSSGEQEQSVNSHDFTSAILVFQNNETAAMLVYMWFLNIFLTIKLALVFAPMNLHSCWPRLLRFHLVLYDGCMIPLAFSLVA